MISAQLHEILQVFDVIINDEHTVISGLDIFRSAGGRSVAHDERVPFQIKVTSILYFLVQDTKQKLEAKRLKYLWDISKIKLKAIFDVLTRIIRSWINRVNPNYAFITLSTS